MANKRLMGELMAEVAPLHSQARRDKTVQKRIEEAVRQLEALANELKQAIVIVEQRGAVMKDLDVGLLDFPAVRDGQAIYLCWRLGEEDIAFYHGVDEGFSGRRPL